MLLILVVVWWMYSGYAWLTNAVAPNSTTRRTLLLTGMAGFLVMALAIPEAFGEYGWLFGVSYLVVNVVHSALFRTAGPGARDAMRVLAPLNLLAALLVLVGGLVPEPWRHLLWVAAPAAPDRRQLPAQDRDAHDRGRPLRRAARPGRDHRDRRVDHRDRRRLPRRAPRRRRDHGRGAGLCVAYYLWWFYFAGDDARAEQVLAAADEPGRRARLALQAWGYAHYPILLGIVVASVGIKKTVGHAFESLHWAEALALSGGVAIYLLGHAAFLALLGLRGVYHGWPRPSLMLAVIPLGHVVAIAQLAAVVVIMVATAIIEDIPEVRRSGSTAIGDFGRTAPHD